MASLTLKQHDNWPPLNATLSDAVGPMDLTGATVKLILVGVTVTITGACTLVDAVNGVVRYTWANGDLAVAGDYSGEFEVTFSTGKIETFPSDSYFTLTVKADLG
jgi:hypothetical protein